MSIIAPSHFGQLARRLSDTQPLLIFSAAAIRLSELVLKRKKRVTCVVCGSKSVEQFLDLRETALANKFLTREELSGSVMGYLLSRIPLVPNDSGATR